MGLLVGKKATGLHRHGGDGEQRHQGVHPPRREERSGERRRHRQVGSQLAAVVTQEIGGACDLEFEPAGVALRGSFLIDQAGVVRHRVLNDLPFRRNVDEILRMVDDPQFTEKHGEVRPAVWTQGTEEMPATPDGAAAYLRKHAGELEPPPDIPLTNPLRTSRVGIARLIGMPPSTHGVRQQVRGSP